MKVRLAPFVLPLLVAAAQAGTYSVTPLEDQGLAQVSVQIGSASPAFRMPAWAPGDYQIFNYGRFLQDVEFRRRGESVAATRGADPNLWTIPGGADEVVYRVRPSRGNFTTNLWMKGGDLWVSGPGVLGWFDGHADESHEIRIQLARGVQGYFSCGLRRLGGTGPSEEPANAARFEAQDYDELIDSPFAAGPNVRTVGFEVLGTPHFITALNAPATADLQSFVRVGRIAAEQGHRLFGEFPYSKYVFFCLWGIPDGGLEHRNSTSLSLFAPTAEPAAGLIFHEFVHTYNVKQIRSKVLGPFDYTQPAVTGALWWLEGVTDYYADVLMVRGGLTTPAAFIADVSRHLARMRQTAARQTVSADEASRRVWEGRGSGGFGGTDYYARGKAIGALLDLAIRGASEGGHSLDDVIQTLYQETRAGRPGFAEGRIRELCVQYGGQALGPLYDDLVHQPGDLPIERALALAGLEWNGAIAFGSRAPEHIRRWPAGGSPNVITRWIPFPVGAAH
jgi:predicted metalloprotease with PDZ domain